MEAITRAKSALKSLFSISTDTPEEGKEAAIPPSYALHSLINTDNQPNETTAPIQSIAMIGAFHDGEGGVYKDDVLLLKNIVEYLEKSGVNVAPDAHVLPMTLRQDEDIMLVQPQVDMAVLCYVYDDKIDKFNDRSNISFLAQSEKIKGVTGGERYTAWQEALESTGAGIIFSLGHPEEISVKKVASDDYIMVIDPQSKTDELPAMLSKMKGKQKSYGLAVHQDMLPAFSHGATLETEFGRMLIDSQRHNEMELT